MAKVHDLGTPPDLEVGNVNLSVATNAPSEAHNLDVAKEIPMAEAKTDLPWTWTPKKGWVIKRLSPMEWIIREYKQRFEQHFIENPPIRGAITFLSKVIYESMGKAVNDGLCTGRVLDVRRIENILREKCDFPKFRKSE